MRTASGEPTVDLLWAEEIPRELAAYIAIPAKSPQFDPDWQANGHIDRAVEHMCRWAREKLAELPGATLEVVRLEGRTPVILIEAPGEIDDIVLLYGHLDKQPEMSGWAEGLGPWTPVLKDDKLYGRGGADDGYAIYASVTALLALQRQGVKRARAVVLIEACEESGSYDLPFYVDHLKDRIGSPSLVICLDSGSGDYERLWITTSLRGLVGGLLTVEVLTEGVHSGDASGIVPDSFRIARALLSRIEDEASGAIRLDAMHAEIPEARRAQAAAAAEILGPGAVGRFPWAEPATQPALDGGEALLARSWRPQLAVIGAEGLPSADQAGNVLRPLTRLKLSLRIPPTCDPDRATTELSRALTRDPPPGVRVIFTPRGGVAGWHAPVSAAWLDVALEATSRAVFGRAPAYLGEGGGIPFMGLLGRRFPLAQFVITGVLGPESNAHGPNEFLHLPTAARITACVARLLDAHAARSRPD